MRRLITEAAATALAEIAPLLRGLRSSPNAKVFYDILSGALWWNDELPEDRQALYKIQNWRVLKYVQRYRTGLILGQPDEFYVGSIDDYREIWDEARRLFPEWPGFDPRRSAPELKHLYETLSADSRRELDEIERQTGDGSDG